MDVGEHQDEEDNVETHVACEQRHNIVMMMMMKCGRVCVCLSRRSVHRLVESSRTLLNVVGIVLRGVGGAF